MKALIHIASIVVLVCGCHAPKGDPARSEEAGRLADTVRTLGEPPAGGDSTMVESRVRVENKTYPLRITSYAVGGLPNDRRFRIRFDYEKYHLDTMISKYLVEDTIEHEYLPRLELIACEFKFVRSNMLYFRLPLDDTRSTASYEITMSIFYRGPKFGRIYYLVRATEG